MMHPDEIERVKTSESENQTRIHGITEVETFDQETEHPGTGEPMTEAITVSLCTYHDSRDHQHPLCPPMGQKGVLIQSWYCCQCGIVGQSVLIDRRLLRALPKFAGEHGPMLNIEYIDASSIGKSKKGR